LILGTPYTSRTVVDDATDQALIMASDGLFDVVDDEKVCELVVDGLRDGLGAQEIADVLCKYSLNRHCRDNICVQVLIL